MSTVLKAIRELDASAMPTGIAVTEGRRALLVGIAVGAALAIAVGVTLVHRSEKTLPAASNNVASNAMAVPAARPAAQAPMPGAAPAPAAQVPHGVPVAAPVVSAANAAPVVASASVLARSAPDPVITTRDRGEDDLPWGRVDVPVAAARPSVDKPVRASRSKAAAAPAPRREATREEVDEEPPPSRTAAREPRADGGRPTGGVMGVPRVEVRAIVFSDDAESRKVVLRIGGGPSVTLHQGETSGGVDVQMIMENSVYLRHHGNIFTARLDR